MKPNQMTNDQFSLWLGGVLGSNPRELNTYIPLTPAEAFKWRDWAVAEYGEDAFDKAMWEVYRSGHDNDEYCYFWWAVYAQPRDYLQAAAELKEKKNG